MMGNGPSTLSDDELENEDPSPPRIHPPPNLQLRHQLNPISSSSSSYKYSVADVIMLVRNIQKSPNCCLPAVLIFEILALTDFSPKLSTKLFKDESHRGQGNQNEQYLSMPIVPVKYFRCLYEIVFKVTAKDQGWSSYPHEQGTRSSNTWGEASLSISPDLRHHVYRNIHAGRSFETQEIPFHSETELYKQVTRETKELSVDAPPPCVLLWLRSMYPGWQQTVSYAEIKIVWRFSEWQQFACDQEKIPLQGITDLIKSNC